MPGTYTCRLSKARVSNPLWYSRSISECSLSPLLSLKLSRTRRWAYILQHRTRKDSLNILTASLKHAVPSHTQLIVRCPNHTCSLLCASNAIRHALDSIPSSVIGKLLNTNIVMVWPRHLVGHYPFTAYVHMITNRHTYTVLSEYDHVIELHLASSPIAASTNLYEQLSVTDALQQQQGTAQDFTVCVTAAITTT